MNKVEELLINAGDLGLSLKQLKSKLGISKRCIIHFIYNSKIIEDVNPLIYGSNKSKINVFKSCKNTEYNYIQRKIVKRKVKKIDKIDKIGTIGTINELVTSV